MNLLADILGLGNMLRGNVKRTLRDPVGHANAQMGAFDDRVKSASKSGDANKLVEALGIGPGAMGGGLVGATVYHGSPYKFTKFDPTKIGSGEGAQAYGYGHYVAQSPEVAKSYQSALTNFRPVNIEQSLVERGISGEAANTYAQWAANTGGAKRSFAAFEKELSEKAPSPYIEQFRQRIRQELPKMKAALDEQAGALYKIDLPDEAIAKMLDYDAPLSKQSEHVFSALDSNPFLRRIKPTPDPTGRGVLGYMDDLGGVMDSTGMRGQPAVAEYLRRIGIPGIRYLDQGSRGAGQGTSNYVVFPGNEDLLRILEVNGQPANKLMGPK